MKRYKKHTMQNTTLYKRYKKTENILKKLIKDNNNNKKYSVKKSSISRNEASFFSNHSIRFICYVSQIRCGSIKCYFERLNHYSFGSILIP